MSFYFYLYILKLDGTYLGNLIKIGGISMNENLINTVDLHRKICKDLSDLYERKNHDYGDSFHQTFVEEGMAMPRIRLGDKFSRFKSLTLHGDQKINDESIRDTLMDLANYAIMTVIEIDRAGIDAVIVPAGWAGRPDVFRRAFGNNERQIPVDEEKENEQ